PDSARATTHLSLTSGRARATDIQTLSKTRAITPPPLRQAQAVDFDLDGWTDIIGLSDKGIPVLLHNDRTERLVHVEGALGPDRDWQGGPGGGMGAAPCRGGNPDPAHRARRGGASLLGGFWE